MLEDTFYLYARFKGMDSKRYYTSNKNYAIKVRVGRFKTKAVTIVHVGDDRKVQDATSERRYLNKASFEKSWKVIKDNTHEQ